MSEPTVETPTVEKPPAHSRAARIWTTNFPGTQGTTYDGVAYEYSPRGELIALNKPLSKKAWRRLAAKSR